MRYKMRDKWVLNNGDSVDIIKVDTYAFEYAVNIYVRGLGMRTHFFDEIALERYLVSSGVKTFIPASQQFHAPTPTPVKNYTLEAPEEFVLKYPAKPKCTCGAHAVNSQMHSSWCDLDSTHAELQNLSDRADVYWKGIP